MDKKIVGLLGAVSAFAALDGAQAATAPQANDVMHVTSYADLLQPIPNATKLLQASDAALAEQAVADGQAKIELAQYYGDGYGYYHHHHHHHRFFRPFYHHHHHRYFAPY